MKCLNYDINVELPNEFIYVYSAILYPNNEDDVIQYSLKVSSDSFFTYANHLYKNYIVALASILIAAKFLHLPAYISDDFPYLKNMLEIHCKNESEESFNKCLLNFANKSVNTCQVNADGENIIIFQNMPTLKKFIHF